jgi:hypothetical protein
MPVLDILVVAHSGGEVVVVVLEALVDFVGVDALFEIQAWRIFSKDVWI